MYIYICNLYMCIYIYMNRYSIQSPTTTKQLRNSKIFTAAKILVRCESAGDMTGMTQILEVIQDVTCLSPSCRSLSL